MASVSSTLFGLLALSSAATAAFNLNTSGPNWDYTTKDLANTTSQTCKDAYSANINCDDTLVGLVASMSLSFDPDSADLESMCTTTCSDSLAQYVENVKSACNQPGDLANVAQGNQGIPNATVATVGQVFQYKYGESCAKDGANFCYLTYPDSNDWAKSDFPCSDTCAVQFFQNAHNEPGSAYFFNYFYLGTQNSYWEGIFTGGWNTVVQCGDAGNNTSSVSASSTSVSSILGASVSTQTATTAAATITGTGATASTAGSATGSSASTPTSSRATSAAVRIRVPFVDLFKLFL